MRKIFLFIAFFPICVFVFAGSTSEESAFNEFFIPYKSATWKRTTTHYDFLKKGTKVTQSSFWYKDGKLKIVTINQDDPSGNKKIYTEILGIHSDIVFSMPAKTGYNWPWNSYMNAHYIAPDNDRKIREDGLEKTGRSETINGVACNIYFGGVLPGFIKKDGNNYLKEWRNPKGFVLKSDFKSLYFERVDEIHDLVPNAVISDSIFKIPSDIKIEDGAKWIKEHPLKTIDPKSLILK